MFRFFKKPKTIAIPGIGIFKIVKQFGSVFAESDYSSESFGTTKLTFEVKDDEVSQHQLSVLKRIESNWTELTRDFTEKCSLIDILIPVKDSYAYDCIECEIVVKSKSNLFSYIVKDNRLVDRVQIE